MTTRELRMQLDLLDPNGNAEVRIRASGLDRSSQPIRTVQLGFNFDQGAVIVLPGVTLEAAKGLRRKSK